jgi:hypothetical protein
VRLLDVGELDQMEVIRKLELFKQYADFPSQVLMLFLPQHQDGALTTG